MLLIAQFFFLILSILNIFFLPNSLPFTVFFFYTFPFTSPPKENHMAAITFMNDPDFSLEYAFHNYPTGYQEVIEQLRASLSIPSDVPNIRMPNGAGNQPFFILVLQGENGREARLALRHKDLYVMAVKRTNREAFQERGRVVAEDYAWMQLREDGELKEPLKNGRSIDHIGCEYSSLLSVKPMVGNRTLEEMLDAFRAVPLQNLDNNAALKKEVIVSFCRSVVLLSEAMRFIPVMQWVAQQSVRPSRKIPDWIFTLARHWSVLSTFARNHIDEPDEFEVPGLRNYNITIEFNGEKDVCVTTIGMVRSILGLVMYEEPAESGSRGNKKEKSRGNKKHATEQRKGKGKA